VGRGSGTSCSGNFRPWSRGYSQVPRTDPQMANRPKTAAIMPVMAWSGGRRLCRHVGGSVPTVARSGCRTTRITTGTEPSLNANHVDDTVLVDYRWVTGHATTAIASPLPGRRA
jgi:hypothetical protein